MSWVSQTDTNSCGPLAVAGTLLLLNGRLPSYRSLGLVGDQFSSSDGDRLRASLLKGLVQLDAIVNRDTGLGQSLEFKSLMHTDI